MCHEPLRQCHEVFAGAGRRSDSTHEALRLGRGLVRVPAARRGGGQRHRNPRGQAQPPLQTFLSGFLAVHATASGDGAGPRHHQEARRLHARQHLLPEQRSRSREEQRRSSGRRHGNSLLHHCSSSLHSSTRRGQLHPRNPRPAGGDRHPGDEERTELSAHHEAVQREEGEGGGPAAGQGAGQQAAAGEAAGGSEGSGGSAVLCGGGHAGVRATERDGDGAELLEELLDLGGDDVPALPAQEEATRRSLQRHPPPHQAVGALL
mmetsp:Transcript_5087/g.18275  ORF Transcript_5087/g.18275 Transcript_5087/m.18275 type:complete len:263 (+) Transcript_5087:351-1139(+)